MSAMAITAQRTCEQFQELFGELPSDGEKWVAGSRAARSASR